MCHCQLKQIIGRGSRIDPATGKLWFRIIDYTGATRLLDARWDRPPTLPVQTAPPELQTAAVEGTIRWDETGDVIQGASVAVMAGPNDQRGPILTDENGYYRFDSLPVGEVTVVAFGPYFNRRQRTITTLAGQTVRVDLDLKPVQASAGSRVITVRNLEVTIAEEATFLVKGLDEPLTLEQYIDYSREWVLKLASNWEALLRLWQDEQERQKVRAQLEQASVHPEVLAEVLDIPDADPVDVLAYVAFRQAPPLTRAKRAEQFRERQATWLTSFPPEQRIVLEALLEKYRLGGVDQMTDPRVFRLPPFKAMGELRGVVQRFGGTEPLRQTLAELQRRLYEV
jgi:type I restriction enzyme R subunit